MFEKAYEAAKTDERKLEIEIKLLKLGFEFEENKKEKLREIDRRIKDHKHKSWINRVFALY